MEFIRTVKEVSSLTGLSESTLRHWEREFKDYLSISRDSQGSRIYTDQDISRFQAINTLRKRGLSIAAIKSILESLKGNQDNQNVNHDALLQVATAQKTTTLDHPSLQSIRQTLQNLPDQLQKIVQQELQKTLAQHKEEMAREVSDILESRLEKYKKQPWWKLWT